MDLRLDGKVAVVTGGSRGIGKAIAAALSAERTKVAIVARGQDGLAEAVKDLTGTGTGVGEVRAFAGNTSEADDVSRVMREIVEKLGVVDILVNCAAQSGSLGPAPPLAQFDEEAYFQEMNTKVLGYLRCAREVAGGMAAKGWGRIINISGLAALQTGSLIGSMRNISVAAMSKNLADELGPQGINVVCLHPGMTWTERTQGSLDRIAAETATSGDEIRAKWATRSSRRRITTAEEVADVACFLASPRSAAINGEIMTVGGGIPGHIFY